MKQPSQAPLSGLIIGIGLVILGIIATFWPASGTLRHDSLIGRGYYSEEVVSDSVSRFAGLVAILLGMFLIRHLTKKEH
jgi:hypothetical protein